jgi:hypothetical protein
VQRAASILSNALQWGIVPTTEAEIGLSPAYSCFLALVAKNTLPLFVVYRPHEAGVLGHLINQMLTAYCMKMRKDGIENIHNRLSNALIVQNTDRT